MILRKVCPQCGVVYGAESRFCSVDGATLVMEQSADDLVGTIVADRYHILERIGVGGMGQVYLAEHVRMKRKSALKVMREPLTGDPVAVSRFHREAENASQITHPNVAAVYDFGETANGLVYIAMEYVPGEPLSQALEEEGSLNPARVADIIAQAADALSAAHGLGILHRDLKPDNIMLTSTRWGTDLVKLVDFGISRAMASATQQFTSTGIIVGTPDYMSPDQLTGDTLDRRSDQYALALIAYYSLTGTFPFPAGSSKEALLTRLTTPPRKLAEGKPHVMWPASLQATLDRALALNAAERYDEVHEFGRDLSAAIGEMEVTETMERYREALRSRFTTPSRSPSVTPPRAIQSLEMTPPAAVPSVDHVVEAATESAPAEAIAAEPEATLMMKLPARRPSRVGRLTAVVAGLALAAVGVWKLAGAGGDIGAVPPLSPSASDAESLPEPQITAPTSEQVAAPATEVLLDSSAALARAGVFTVYGAGQQGTGFLVDSLGIVLTSRDLARGPGEPRVQLDADRRVIGRVIAVDSARGIAALRIPFNHCRRCAVLSIAADSVGRVSVGDSLVVPASVTRGTASIETRGAVTQSDRRGVLASLRVGFSGSPVLTKDRGIVGLALRRPRGSATLVTADALNELRSSARRRREIVPNDTLVPSWPLTPVARREIAAALTRSEAELEPYQATQDGITVLLMTPQVMAWRSEQVKQNLAASQVMAIGDTLRSRRIDPIQNWSEWNDYVAERRAVVVLHVTPELAGYDKLPPQGVVDLRRGDVVGVRLYRANALVAPIDNVRIPAMVNPQSYRAQRQYVYNSGIAVYSPREFAPNANGSWPEMWLEIADARPSRTVKLMLPVAALQAVQRDLSSYQR